MPVIQYTPVKFRRGRVTHANLLYNPRGTVCGKSMKGGVIIATTQLDCVACMSEIVKARITANKKSRRKLR